MDGLDRVGNQALALAGYHSGTDKAEAALKNPRGNPKTYNHVRTILGPNFTRRWPRGQSAESSFTDLIDQMKTEKQSRAAEPSFDDLINQMKSEKQYNASSPASDSQSLSEPPAELDTAATKRRNPTGRRVLTNNLTKQQLVQHLKEGRASGQIPRTYTTQ